MVKVHHYTHKKLTLPSQYNEDVSRLQASLSNSDTSCTDKEKMLDEKLLNLFIMMIARVKSKRRIDN